MTAFILFGWAAFIAVAPPPVAESSPPENSGTLAFVTHYTCEYHPRNVMATTPGSCIATADGSDPHAPGVACPDRSWLGRWVEIPGYGLLRCDDVPYHAQIYGLPHFDIRLVGEGAFPRALQLGAGAMTVHPIQEPPHALSVSPVYRRTRCAGVVYDLRCGDDPVTHLRWSRP